MLKCVIYLVFKYFSIDLLYSIYLFSWKACFFISIFLCEFIFVDTFTPALPSISNVHIQTIYIQMSTNICILCIYTSIHQSALPHVQVHLYLLSRSTNLLPPFPPPFLPLPLLSPKKLSLNLKSAPAYQNKIVFIC